MNQHRPATSKFRHLLAAASLAALATGFTPAFADTQQSERFYNEGVQQLQSGNASAAVIQLRNAIQQDPANLKARQLLGELYLRTGDAVSAEKELRRVFEGQRSDEVELRLDLSGEQGLFAVRLTPPSFRFRGEGRAFSQAALRPTVAHGLVWLSSPAPEDSFVDPFCGSGMTGLAAQIYRSPWD